MKEQSKDMCSFCNREFTGTFDEVEIAIEEHNCDPNLDKLFMEEYASSIIRASGLGKMLYVCPRCEKAYQVYEHALKCKHNNCPSYLSAPKLKEVKKLELKGYNEDAKSNVLQAFREKLNSIKNA